MDRALLAAIALLATACTGDVQPPPPTTTTATAAPSDPASSAASAPTRRATGPSSGATSQGRQLVWVAVERDQRVVLVDLASGGVVREVPTRGGAHNIAVGRDGTVAASLYGTTRLALITPDGAQSVDVGDRPHDPKPVPGGFVVANEAGRRLDFVSRQGQAGPRVALHGEPHDVAVERGGRRAWTTMNGSGDLAVVDIGTAEVVRYVPTGYAPHDLLFAPDGRLWVTDWNGRLLVVDGSEVTRSVPLGVEAHHVAFTPDGAQAWITDQAISEVFVLDTRTLEVLDTIALRGAPHHVAITADGRYAAIADNTNGTLVIYGVSNRERVDVIDVGNGPHGVWAAPPR